MLPRPATQILLLLVALSACARSLPVRGPAARSAIEPSSVDAVFSSAVVTLENLGFRLESCDSARAALATEPIELDVPCAGRSCLAREVVTLKLGYRVAKLSLARQEWSATVKEWIAVRDGSVERAEAALLADVMERFAAGPPRGRSDACVAAAACAGGACVADAASAR